MGVPEAQESCRGVHSRTSYKDGREHIIPELTYWTQHFTNSAKDGDGTGFSVHQQGYRFILYHARSLPFQAGTPESNHEQEKDTDRRMSRRTLSTSTNTNSRNHPVASVSIYRQPYGLLSTDGTCSLTTIPWKLGGPADPPLATPAQLAGAVGAVRVARPQVLRLALLAGRAAGQGLHRGPRARRALLVLRADAVEHALGCAGARLAGGGAAVRAGRVS